MRILLASCLLLLVAGPAHAGRVTHQTRPGESFEQLALHYYGRAELGPALRAHNSLAGEPGPGTVLEIPLGDVHRVEEADDWPLLAERYWGAGELGSVMPELVEPRGAPLRAGTELRIPSLIEHRVAPNENLAVLSRRSYGDADRALAIAALNGLDDPDRLRAGQALRVPVFGEVGPAPAPVAAAPRVAATAGVAEPLPSPSPSDALRDAIQAYHEGEYETARAELERLRGAFPGADGAAPRRALHEHLLRVHVAFDDTELACRSLAELRQELRREGIEALDPEQFSPKIRELETSCP